MVCKVVHAKLFQYFDGELPQEQRAALESHVASCAECRRLVDLERTFRETCVEPLEPEPAPGRVRDQVSRLLDALTPDQSPTGRSRKRLASPGVLAGAVALVFLGGILAVGVERLWNTANPSVLRLAEASVEQHQKLSRGILPHDITQMSPRAAEQWFGRRLDFNVSLPELQRESLTFVGGRISHLRDFEVAALHYRLEGKDVSLFVIPLERYRQLGLGDSPKFKMVTHQGYDVIVWASHGAAYSLVSEIGGRSCLVCHTSEEKIDLMTQPSGHR